MGCLPFGFLLCHTSCRAFCSLCFWMSERRTFNAFQILNRHTNDQKDIWNKFQFVPHCIFHIQRDWKRTECRLLNADFPGVNETMKILFLSANFSRRFTINCRSFVYPKWLFLESDSVRAFRHLNTVKFSVVNLISAAHLGNRFGCMNVNASNRISVLSADVIVYGINLWPTLQFKLNWFWVCI